LFFWFDYGWYIVLGINKEVSQLKTLNSRVDVLPAKHDVITNSYALHLTRWHCCFGKICVDAGNPFPSGASSPASPPAGMAMNANPLSNGSSAVLNSAMQMTGMLVNYNRPVTYMCSICKAIWLRSFL